MRPTSTTFSAPIAAPLEKVFHLLANPDAFPSWMPGCQAANTLGALKKGSRVSITFGADRTTILYRLGRSRRPSWFQSVLPALLRRRRDDPLHEGCLGAEKDYRPREGKDLQEARC